MSADGSLRRALVFAALLAACAWAQAGPMAVRAPDGVRWILNEDDEPTTVERRLPDGKLDPGFGRNGRAAIEFTGADVTVNALRVDTAGHIWVAGTTSGNGVSSPALQRLQANGQLDSAWAVGGRSTATPAGQRLMVVDMLPQADGSTWLLGTLIAAQGEGDAGLWRLRPDGALDYGFGIAGVWKRPGTERSRALSLAAGPDGLLGIGLEVLGRNPHREIYLLAPGEKEPQLDPRTPPATNDEDDDEAFLIWTGVFFWWRPGPQTAELAGLPVMRAGLRPPPSASTAEVGHTALNPFSDPTPEVASAPAAPEAGNEGLPWGWLIGGAAALVILGVFWRRR